MIFLEELDFQPTRLGDLMLRRRREPAIDNEWVYEVKLGEEFLMSSLFTVAEEELSRLGLAEASGDTLRVVVGGLGLGYTAATALADPRVGHMTVVDGLAEVIGWHEKHLLPLGEGLSSDKRCHFLHADFFAWIRDAASFDVLLLDVDHAPDKLLHPSHAWLYESAGLQHIASRLTPGGVFALWSNDPPDPAFEARLAEHFVDVRSEVVRFDNPLRDCDETNTVYLAKSTR